ncbi:MAG: hypothetical protein ACRDRN_24845 [Sciscionella sp.]
MPEVRISLSSQGAQEFRALSRKLKDTGRKDLRTKLRRGIIQAGKPVVADVQEAVLSLHTTSTGNLNPKSGNARRREHNIARARSASAVRRAERLGAGLRESTARATRLQVTARGVKIITDSNKLPESQRSLPRHMDSPKGWRHPVFGNRHVWVLQKAGPWFASTISKKAPKFRQAILQTMDDVTRDLES